MQKLARNAKNERCIAGYFTLLFSLFVVIRNISCQDWHSCEKSKDFVVYFFVALIKHEIRMQCEKCIVSVSYFVVFCEKQSRNAKCEKCVAGLTGRTVTQWLCRKQSKLLHSKITPFRHSRCVRDF